MASSIESSRKLSGNEVTTDEKTKNESDDQVKSEEIALYEFDCPPSVADTEEVAADEADGSVLNDETLTPLLNTNQYAIRKMAAQALMDVALMMANISQLRTLITAGADRMDYFYTLIVLVALSLGAQIIFAILIFIIWMKESDFQQKEEYLNTIHEVERKGGLPVKTTEKVRLSMMKREEEFRQHRITSHLNYITMVLVFLITVINMFITGFGIKLDPTTP